MTHTGTIRLNNDDWYTYMAGSGPADYPDEASLRRFIGSLRRDAKMHISRAEEARIIRFWKYTRPSNTQKVRK